MSPDSPSGWTDKVIGMAFGLFMASIALYCAVQVLRAVLPFLIVGIGIAALVAVGIAGVRWRRGRW